MTQPREPAGIELIQAGAELAAEIAAMHGKLFAPGWDSESVSKLLDRSSSLSLVARAPASANLVGFLLGQLAADEAEILSIGVAAPWQRRGVGWQLLTAWSGLAARSGATRLFLEVAADNAPAVSMYAAQGFREVNRRKAYYRAACDALVLAKQL